MSASDAVDPERVFAGMEALVAAHASEEGVVLGGIHGDLPHRNEAAAAWIESELAALSLPVQIESEDANGWVTRNIIVDWPGSSDEVVLICAHYDVWYTAAADNSAGVAVLLELARLLPELELQKSVRLVFFDMEEPGLYGSRRYFDAHADDPVSTVLNLDSLGFTAEESGLPTVERGDFLAIIANEPALDATSWVLQLAAGSAVPLEVLAIIGESAGSWPAMSSFSSDHEPAWELGIPGLFFSDTGPLRNPHFHTEDDLPDTVDADFLGDVARLTAASAVALGHLP